jgi:membrane associated rhomboid family serine protease
MLLLPIGIHENEVRRHPIVSYTIMAVTLVVFLLTTLLPYQRDLRRQVGAAAQETFQFFEDHPYLEAPPEIRPLIPDDVAAELSEARSLALTQQNGPSQHQLEVDQGKLNALSANFGEIRARLPSFRYGLIPSAPTVYGFVTYIFLHGGWLHLLGNLLFFFLSGPFIEDLYGRPLFLVLYLAFGATAGLAHLELAGSSSAPLIGASGAIAGVMGVFCFRLFNKHVRFLCIPFIVLPFWHFTFKVRAIFVLPLWFAEQVVYARFSPDAGVAWWAHIGGFLAGLVAALLIGILGVERHIVNPAIEAKVSWTQDPRLSQAADALAAGNHGRAMGLARAVATDQPRNSEAWQLLFDSSIRLPHLPTLALSLPKLMAACEASGLTNTLVTTAYTVQEHVDGIPGLLSHVPPRLWTRAAQHLKDSGHFADARDLQLFYFKKYPMDPNYWTELFALLSLLQDEDRGGEIKTLVQEILKRPDSAPFRDQLLAFTGSIPAAKWEA